MLDGSDLDQWLHQEHVQVVEAPRFDETQMSEFVNGLLGRHSLGSEFMRRAATITEGNPFFTIELLRDLIDQDLLMRRAGVWQAVGDDFRLPESVSRLIERRLGRLGPLPREVCLQLAVAGGHLSLATLVELFDLDETELLHACDELVGHRIGEIRDDDVRLIHDSLRERIYQTATDHEREEYHQRLGSYLERTLPADAFDRSSAVGYHFSRGRDRIRGLGYLEDAGRDAFHREEHGVARNLLMDADHLLTNLPDVEDRDLRQYAVRKMLMFVCVSNDYVRGAEVGEWVYQHAVARSLSSLPLLQRFLPDPLPYLFVLGVELPLRMLRRGMKALRQFESDVGDIFLATGYLCNCLASTSQLTTSRERARRLLAFAVTRNSLAIGACEIAQTISKYHQEVSGIKESFRHARRIFQTSKRFRSLDEYSQCLMLGVCYHAEELWDAWEQHPAFDRHLQEAEQFAARVNNHFAHHLNAQAKVENAVYGGDIAVADAAEAEFYAAMQKLGGKSRQREWLVEFAMGLLDVSCGRFDRAARRRAVLERDGSGFFTEGYGALIGARLNVAWGNLEDALSDAQTAMRWALDPEVMASVFQFRVQSTLAEIHTRSLRPVAAREAIQWMKRYADQPGHQTNYFSIEASRYESALVALSDPNKALKLAQATLGAASEGNCRLQLAEAHTTLAEILLLTGASEATVRQHVRQAGEIYRQLRNHYREKLVESLVSRDSAASKVVSLEEDKT